MRFIRLRRVGLFLVLLLGLLFIPSARVAAQEFKADITGTVTDPQGGVLPGVTVTAVNVDTDVSVVAVTDTKGVYSVKDLIPGRYRLTAALQGFKSFTREGIVLHTAETATINVGLAIGAVEESVTVTAGLTETETNQSVLSQTMDNKKVSELPLNGRQVYMLLQLTSGTLFTQQTFGASGFSGTRAWDVNGSVSIHGSRTGNNEFLIDGASNAGTGGWSYAPPVDAIEEFKVDSASTDASVWPHERRCRQSDAASPARISSMARPRRSSAAPGSIRTPSRTIQNNISNAGHKLQSTAKGC